METIQSQQTLSLYALQPDASAEKLLDSFIEVFRIAEIANGPGSFLMRNLPDRNCTRKDKIEWFKKAGTDILRYITAGEKHKDFRFGTRSERALINQKDRFVKQLSKNLGSAEKKENHIQVRI